MKLQISKSISIQKWYWLPKRITLQTSPPMYHWGFWTYSFVDFTEWRKKHPNW